LDTANTYVTAIIFEGDTTDEYETTVAVVDPTADRTITLPNLTGTVSLIDATETLTNKTLTTPVITEIDSASSITLDAAAGDIALTPAASYDVNIPANIGLTFGDDGEKIEGDGTHLTISSGDALYLTATSDVIVPADVGITFGSGEKIEGNNTDLTVTSGADINLTAVGDVNIPSGVGVTFGNDGEKIEGDGTDLTIVSSGDVNLTPTGTFVVPAHKLAGSAIDIDSGTDGTSITVASTDKFLVHDSGTTKYINASQIASYASISATEDSTALAIALG
jgi:hypothetical protein